MKEKDVQASRQAEAPLVERESGKQESNTGKKPGVKAPRSLNFSWPEVPKVPDL